MSLTKRRKVLDGTTGFNSSPKIFIVPPRKKETSRFRYSRKKNVDWPSRFLLDLKKRSFRRLGRGVLIMARLDGCTWMGHYWWSSISFIDPILLSKKKKKKRKERMSGWVSEWEESRFRVSFSLRSSCQCEYSVELNMILGRHDSRRELRVWRNLKKTDFTVNFTCTLDKANCRLCNAQWLSVIRSVH